MALSEKFINWKQQVSLPLVIAVGAVLIVLAIFLAYVAAGKKVSPHADETEVHVRRVKPSPTVR